MITRQAKTEADTYMRENGAYMHKTAHIHKKTYRHRDGE
jgi:hypothetical protein